ncbi:hypothetical protein [Thermobispora bispora]|jgi:hypothetical protein|nr:hypothetical protein [Thermobispora bispora]
MRRVITFAIAVLTSVGLTIGANATAANAETPQVVAFGGWYCC